MITYERFAFALANLDSRYWRAFEQLANSFLADEFPELRPMALAAGGDEGMDAILFQPNDDPTTVLQYSVRKDWSAKIRATCKRLKDTAADTRVLIYATNQAVGTEANTLKKGIRADFGIYLDIRDREWFLTQRNASARATQEAIEFSSAVADPGAISTHVVDRQARAIDDLDARAAVVYLKLQWEDDARSKGLTQVCFEAVVRSVLRNTTPESRMTRAQIRQQVALLLPSQHRKTSDSQVDGALKRMRKVYIRHYQKLDEFCLTYDERQRLADRLADISAMDQALTDQLGRTISQSATEMAISLDSLPDDLVDFTRRTLERVLLDRGEAFASAIAREESSAFVAFADIEAVVDRETAKKPPSGVVDLMLVVAAIQAVLLNPADHIRKYLRSLADTYTLFAFMRETPDVQSAITKIFSEGDFWLDTNVILPLLAETLLDEPARAHTQLVKAIREAGLRLYVTDGVVEEVAGHISRCRAYARALGTEGAAGDPPFLLACHSLSGQPANSLPTWLETFAGTRRIEDDVADYLESAFDIEVLDLSEVADRGDPILRAMVAETWHEVREAREAKRQARGIPPMDPGNVARLVSHDVVNYVGVVQRRVERNERRSPFGYRSWWLTADRSAHRMANGLRDRLPDRPPASPTLSLDFMLHYLAIGPVRAKVSRRTEEVLPLMMNMSVLDAVPPSLLELANEVRAELEGLPANVIARKIRDTLDEARMLLGPETLGGEGKLTDDVKARLIAQARSR